MGSWRYYVQRATTGQWLHTDVPNVTGGEQAIDLSGPGYLKFTVPADVAAATADDGDLLFRKWGSKIIVEEDQQITWCGLYTFGMPDGQGGVAMEALGLTGWPQRVPYEGPTITGWQPDAFDVVRSMYSWMQGTVHDLGMIVDGHKAGLGPGDPQPPAKPVRKPGESLGDFSSRQVDWNTKYAAAEKYRLAWWDTQMIGAELDQLAAEIPFDYREDHAWLDRDALTLSHKLRLGTPTLRRRRDDVRLAEGENITLPTQSVDNGDAFANRVLGLGAGEGSKMRRVTVGTPDGVLPVTQVYAAKNVSSLSRLRAAALNELKLLQTPVVLDSVTARDLASYTPMSTVLPGDEVYVTSSRSGQTVAGWYLVKTRKHTDDGGWEFDFGAAA